MPRRTVQERLDEQTALIEKAQKRNNEIELNQVKRIQRIAEKAGVYETDNPEKLIDEAIKKTVSAAKKESKTEKKANAKNTKNEREIRVYQQNVARIERATRTIRRLKNEARRIDASQKWRLGFLLQLANLDSMDLLVLDEKLGHIKLGLSDTNTQKKWQLLGSESLREHKKTEQKDTSGNSAYRVFESDKADSHRKITLGGLVKKHELESISPALLLGALLEFKH